MHLPNSTSQAEQFRRSPTYLRLLLALVTSAPALALIAANGLGAQSLAMRLAIGFSGAGALAWLLWTWRRQHLAHNAALAALRTELSTVRQHASLSEMAVSGLQTALNSVCTGLIWVDRDGSIRFSNQAARQLLRSAQAPLQQRFPDSNIELQHGAQCAAWPVFATVLAAVEAKGCVGPESLVLGECTLEWTVAAVPATGGEHATFLIQLRDASAEAHEGAEISKIIAAVEAGDLSRRLKVAGKPPAAQQIAKGFNRLVGTMSRGLEDTARVLNAISRGVLTERVTGEFSGTFEQLKEDSNGTVDRLRETIEKIQGISQVIREAAREIADGNLDLSNRTEQQAGNVEKTASAMEELNSTVRQNADHARRASELATRSDTVAREGARIVIDVVTTMGTIQESSKRITDIVGVIDGIAFQTNILALNAAVEAARAGEQGRGFAVVATEVRALAQRSAAAAKEIKTLIGSSVERVEHGASLASNAGRIIEEVVTSVREVHELLGQVASASQEQSQGLTQVTDAIQQLDHGTQQNAALVEQAAAAAASLHEQAGSLNSAVERFHLNTDAPGVGTGAAATLDYDTVIAAHLQWKHKLRDYLDGRGPKLDAELVSRDDKCALGCWIHGDRSRDARHSGFELLKSTHAEFHRCAGRVIRHHQAKEDEVADQLLNDEFLALSERTVQYLRTMKKASA